MIASVTSTVYAAVPAVALARAGAKTTTSVSFPVPQLSGLQTLSDRAFSLIEYVPDLWTAMDAGLILAAERAYAVPAAVRTAVAAFGALNLLLVPTMVIQSLTVLWQVLTALPARGLPSVIEGVSRVPYFASLAAAFTAVGAAGVRQIAEKLNLQIGISDPIPAVIASRLGYALRLGAIPQLMDISSGMEGNDQMSHVLQPLSWFEAALSVLPSRGHYQKSIEALDILANNKRFYRKVADAGFDLDQTIETIRGQASSWILPISWMGCYRARILAKSLQERGVVKVQNQMLGLAANTCAIMGMIVCTHIIATATFAILQSIFYLLQTYHQHTQGR